MNTKVELLVASMIMIGSSAYAKSFEPLGVGFSAPQVNGVANVRNPNQGDIVLDTTATTTGTFKGYAGTTDGWVALSITEAIVAKMSTTTSITVGVSFTKINFDTILMDSNSALNLTTDRFVAPANGTYLVSIEARSTPSTAEEGFNLQVLKNGTTAYDIIFPTKSTTVSALRVSGSGAQLVDMLQNDYLEFGASIVTGSPSIDRATVSIMKVRD